MTVGSSVTPKVEGEPLPADLVQRVADEVYRLLLFDLRREREWRGDYGSPRTAQGVRRTPGGSRG
jgi:hypothetical protein